MTQRNPLNDRYQTDERIGKTRKSAASAKPKTKASASVREPAPKTKKQKKAERRARERKESQKASEFNRQTYNPPTAAYRRVRRLWWVFLGIAIVLTVISAVMTSQPSLSTLAIAPMILAYVFIIGAFYLEFGKARKMRKRYQEQVRLNKSKAVRAEQKRRRNELREQEKEAEAAYAAAKEEKAPKKSLFGFLNRSKKNTTEKTSDSAPDGSSQ